MQHTYKGDIYSYEPWEDREDDNIKIFHDVYLIDRDIQGDRIGRTVQRSMPMSPYSTPSFDEFVMWIECGMPTSKEMGLGGNARKGDIKEYYTKWLDDKIDQVILGEQYVSE